MSLNNKLKTVSIDTMIDKHIGKKGTKKRDAFENELRLDLIGEAIKQARKDRNMTQEELGHLVGVQKAQISKLENCLTDARPSCRIDLRPQGSGTPLRSLSCQCEGIALPPGGPFTASGVNLVGPRGASRPRSTRGLRHRQQR